MRRTCYHNLEGSIHCGTNVLRVFPANVSEQWGAKIVRRVHTRRTRKSVLFLYLEHHLNIHAELHRVGIG